MKENSYIDLSSLTDEELAGVINIYPWFSIARKKMCERMSLRGEEPLKVLPDTTLFVTDAAVLMNIRRKGTVLPDAESIKAAKAPSDVYRRVVVVGGDYFSGAEYEQVTDGGFKELSDILAHKSSPVAKQVPKYEVEGDSAWEDREEFYTEALAGIYAQQGYYSQAKKIYQHLILEYPEKSVYFASFIDELDKLEIKN